MSPQLSCGATCQMMTWYSINNVSLTMIKYDDNKGTKEIDLGTCTLDLVAVDIWPNTGSNLFMTALYCHTETSWRPQVSILSVRIHNCYLFAVWYIKRVCFSARKITIVDICKVNNAKVFFYFSFRFLQNSFNIIRRPREPHMTCYFPNDLSYMFDLNHYNTA